MNSMELDDKAAVWFSLRDLAERLGAELRGDPEARISGVAGIEAATGGDLTFVANPRYAGMARTTRAGAILVAPEFAELATATLRTSDPYLAFARAIELFHPSPVYAPGVHPTAVVSASARVGTGAHLGAYVVVMDDVEIGEGAVLLPHVVVYPGARIGRGFFAHAHAVVREGCLLGDDVTLGNGAVIGGDGFGYAREGGRPRGAMWHKIRQSGPAVLEDGVEVQANACVDRASVGETRVGAGSKVDNLVQVGHGSRVGADTLLCAQVGLAGSTEVGDRVILAGQVGVAGHCVVGNDVLATAQSGIPSDVAAGEMVSGYPAIANRRWLKSVAVFHRLPDLVRNLKSAQK